MMKAQIQIQFPLLGEWDKLNMTAVFPSSGGFIESRIYTENDIPPSHAPALEAVVEAWQVQQVWARVEQFISKVPEGEQESPIEMTEGVVLTVDAVNESGGHRRFTSVHYPDFVLMNSAAVDFFKHFTK